MLEASLFSAVSKTRPTTIPSPRAYHSMGPGARVIHDMAVCNGKLYLFGGAQRAATTYLGDFWEFNPTGRVWTKIE